ncbi:hypothetical protein [Amycolatopsis lexingtonensis]|uniref:hypothetical protein n=1 Tax=Amycolatopsis lexingtonensis TaxID=218822 RepID=UPI003F714D41
MWYLASAPGTPDSATVGFPLKCIDTKEYRVAYNRQRQAMRVWQYNNCTGEWAKIFPGGTYTPQGWTIDAVSP